MRIWTERPCWTGTIIRQKNIRSGVKTSEKRDSDIRDVKKCQKRQKKANFEVRSDNVMAGKNVE